MLNRKDEVSDDSEREAVSNRVADQAAPRGVAVGGHIHRGNAIVDHLDDGPGSVIAGHRVGDIIQLEHNNLRTSQTYDVRGLFTSWLSAEIL